ncbi:MAG: hypothetical protein GAK44_00251 [Pseudomonas delhiensis]|nr:MAG: hypothetical protein GAK44_00251 [Pseudomonas delhiensis]
MIAKLKSALPSILLVLGLPLASMGILLDANEYRSWGGAGVDCDGPAVVALFAVPALLIYVACTLAFLRHAISGKSWLAALACTASLMLSILLANNLHTAWVETQSADFLEVCS